MAGGREGGKGEEVEETGYIGITEVKQKYVPKMFNQYQKKKKNLAVRTLLSKLAKLSNVLINFNFLIRKAPKGWIN